jgi:hypothetical protein
LLDRRDASLLDLDDPELLNGALLGSHAIEVEVRLDAPIGDSAGSGPRATLERPIGERQGTLGVRG